MFALKSISHDSVSGALAKAERYRLLNEPVEAESICRDILEIEPDNQQALISLLLALTDQVADNPRTFTTALAVVDRQRLRRVAARLAAVIRIEAIWLATEPLDMRRHGDDPRACRQGLRCGAPASRVLVRQQELDADEGARLR